MPMPRRAANRQEILDAYSDMSSADQESLIAELSQIHRILKRDRQRGGAPVLIADSHGEATVPLPIVWIERDLEKEARLTPSLSSVTFGEHEQ